MVPSKSSTDSKEKEPWPDLPKAFQHSMSMRWLTLESLRILQNRLHARHESTRVWLLTGAGTLEGLLCEITNDYESSVAEDNLSDIDVASATVHIRTDMWNMYSNEDKELTTIDTAAVLHLSHVKVRTNNHFVSMKHLAVFAGDVIAFGLGST